MRQALSCDANQVWLNLQSTPMLPWEGKAEKHIKMCNIMSIQKKNSSLEQKLQQNRALQNVYTDRQYL